MTGFDPEIVSSSIKGVISAYNSLSDALITQMQTSFVNAMATKWACKNAQNFFTTSFKPSVDSLITQSNTLFTSVVSAMNSSAIAWATATESTYSPISFETNNTLMDIEGIQESINGVRGIDLEGTPEVVNTLKTIAGNAESALESAVGAVQSCGFIGGDQAANLIASLNTIKSNVNSAVSEITSTVKTAIDQTVTAYGNTKGQIEQAFNGE